MGLTEAIVRVIFWPRVRRAKQIGEAAALIGEGRAEETLARLAKMERRIPPYLGHLFFLTRGRALDALDRLEESEQAYLAAVFAKQGATVAHIHLAVLCGRQRRFDEARDWLRRLREDEHPEAELLAQAEELLGLLDEVQGGGRREELRARAEAFARSRGLEGRSLAEAAQALDEWIDASPDEAREQCDELACLLGELALSEGGQWLLSLSLEDSLVALGEGTFAPFAAVSARLDGEDRLESLIARDLRGCRPEAARAHKLPR